jgi:TPR repeat protein
MYVNGDGVTQDYVRAHAYFNLSASNGYNQAQKNRDYISNQMTKEQIAEAQSLVKTLLK